VTCYSKNWKR